MEGHEEQDRGRITAAAEQPIDVVIDLLPPMASVSRSERRCWPCDPMAASC
jgi:hypothetical protein